ncbi:hypothetical protein C8J56DRAFT_1041534 [Mycena floridula]|nr:hypothetical protein C8J56DRAFT_1041534 [Mycena floridula]
MSLIAASTLMHSALAYFSSEMQTLDAIITTETTPLPREILLIIRSELFFAITSSLISSSTSALQHYESSLLRMLCSDCLDHNTSIYGYSIWDWGPCGCFQIRWKPRRLAGRSQWLEHHLSRKSVHRLERRPWSSDIIWVLVEKVLGEFGCEITGHRFPQVLIVPTVHAPDANLAVKRAERELGLFIEHRDPLQVASPVPLSSTRSNAAVSTFDFSIHLLPNAILAFTEVVTLPFTYPFSLILTITCFYSKPAAFRIL